MTENVETDNSNGTFAICLAFAGIYKVTFELDECESITVTATMTEEMHTDIAYQEEGKMGKIELDDDDEYIIVKKNGNGVLGFVGIIMFIVAIGIISSAVANGLASGIHAIKDGLKDMGILKTQYSVVIDQSESDSIDVSKISVMVISKSEDNEYEIYDLNYNKKKDLFKTKLGEGVYDIYLKYDGGMYSFNQFKASGSGSLQSTLPYTSYIDRGLVRLTFYDTDGNEILPESIEVDSNEFKPANDGKFYLYCNFEDAENNWLISVPGYEDMTVDFSTEGMRVCDLEITLNNTETEKLYKAEKSTENAIVIGCAIDGDVSVESIKAISNESQEEISEALYSGSQDFYLFNDLENGVYEICASLSNGETSTKLLQVNDSASFYLLLISE